MTETLVLYAEEDVPVADGLDENWLESLGDTVETLVPYAEVELPVEKELDESWLEPLGAILETLELYAEVDADSKLDVPVIRVLDEIGELEPAGDTEVLMPYTEVDVVLFKGDGATELEMEYAEDEGLETEDCMGLTTGIDVDWVL